MGTGLAGMARIERVTLGERAYGALRELLLSGAVAPGEKLSLRSVAATLGVSIMPVREAVSRLVADGALAVLPNRAVTVPVMTHAKFRELTTVRLAVEGFAAEQAAAGRSEADLAGIRRLDEAFRREVEAPRADALAALRLNKELHFAIYAATGLPSLVAIIEGLWLKVGPVINLDLKSSTERLVSGGAEGFHADCVAAIAARDGPAARAALTADIENAARFIVATGRLPD
ncbi:GntR family transcriptional regulator [Inquilinus sp. NPDC058860]|uniref:GntR family transcriptional regulator n=1 Tax=Inquilinus sp. NPDC058860 TaxID=3346652 RepID=UPI00367AD0AD